jgi:diguanylate cyclase (GGDEF)-like protein
MTVDKSDHYISSSSIVHQGQAASPVYLRDISNSKQLEDKFNSEIQQEWKNIFQAIGHPAVILDPRHVIIAANRAARKVSCEAEINILGKKCYKIFHGKNCKTFPDGCPLEILLSTNKMETVEMEMSAFGGTFLVSCTPIFNDRGQIENIIHIATEISERKRAEETIQQMAFHDSLTGLPNRKLFSDRLGIALAHARRSQKKVAVAMLDLDHFKVINDTLGHDVGDLLLKATAERLGIALRQGDTVARFGGDEFLVILPGLEVKEDALNVVQKIVDSFCKPFFINTNQLVVTISIGIAVYPRDGIDEGTLLKNADNAMYLAKQGGRARCQFCKTV